MPLVEAFRKKSEWDSLPILAIKLYNMKLSAPTQILWVIAVIIGVLGIMGHLTSVKYLTEYKFFLVMVGFILLVIGTLFKKA